MTRLTKPGCLISLAFLLALTPAAALADQSGEFNFSGLSAKDIAAQAKTDPDFPSLSPGASDTIDALKLRQSILELKRSTDTSGDAVRLMLRKQELINKLIITSVEVQAVVAEIDGEIARTNGYQQMLEQRRYRIARNSTVATFMTSGMLSAIGSSMNISPKLSTVPGNTLQIAGSATDMGIPAWQLYKMNQISTEQVGNPTMLATLFDRPADGRTKFPETIWSYLNCQAPWAPQYSKKDFLIGRWIRLKHLPRRGGKFDTKKLDAVCGTLEPNQVLTYQDMIDQISMLTDLRAVIALMNQDIVEILHLVQK